MKIHRFCLENLNTLINSNGEIETNDADVIHQMKDVFRYSAGDTLNIFDGQSIELYVEILEIHKKNVKLKILNELDEIDKIEKQNNIHLAFALLKNDHTEMVLEKCTELGVSTFSPLISDRVIKTGFRKDRLEKIIKEATEQSGFIKLPKLNEPMKLLDFINTNENLEKQIYVLDFDGENIKNILNKRDAGEGLDNLEYIILVGPEGGWSEQEREMFKTKNLPTISLGRQTLRAETASIAISSLFL